MEKKDLGSPRKKGKISRRIPTNYKVIKIKLRKDSRKNKNKFSPYQHRVHEL